MPRIVEVVQPAEPGPIALSSPETVSGLPYTSSSMDQQQTVTLALTKETPHMKVFSVAEGERMDASVPSVYVRKAALARMGEPDRIRLVIEPA